MPTFQSKSTKVQAKQWFPPGDNRHDPSMLRTYSAGEIRTLGDLFLQMKGGLPQVGGEDRYAIRTPSGDAKVNPGDWIVTGPRTDIIDRYPCDPVTFSQKYELAPEQ